RPTPMTVLRFGRELCGSLTEASAREWLVADGVGFAMGTVAGLRTRRYHGLLIAAAGPSTRRPWLDNLRRDDLTGRLPSLTVSGRSVDSTRATSVVVGGRVGPDQLRAVDLVLHAGEGATRVRVLFLGGQEQQGPRL